MFFAERFQSARVVGRDRRRRLDFDGYFRIANNRIYFIFVVLCVPETKRFFDVLIREIGAKFLNNQVFQSVTINVGALLERQAA